MPQQEAPGTAFSSCHSSQSSRMLQKLLCICCVIFSLVFFSDTWVFWLKRSQWWEMVLTEDSALSVACSQHWGRNPNIFQIMHSSSASIVGAGEMQENFPNSQWETLLWRQNCELSSYPHNRKGVSKFGRSWMIQIFKPQLQAAQCGTPWTMQPWCLTSLLAPILASAHLHLLCGLLVCQDSTAPWPEFPALLGSSFLSTACN